MARNTTAVCKLAGMGVLALLFGSTGATSFPGREGMSQSGGGSSELTPIVFFAQDSDGIPEELRGHVLSRYHSSTAREAISRSFVEVRRGGAARQEGWAFLMDLHDDVITAWILQPLNRHFGGDTEPIRMRRDLASLALGIGLATIASAPESEDPAVENAEDDPRGHVGLLGALLSEAVGVEFEQPTLFARPETQRWVERTLQRGIERATDRQTQAWLRYCLERVRGASR